MGKKQPTAKNTKPQKRDDTSTTITSGALIMCLFSAHDEMLIERIMFFVGAAILFIGLVLSYVYAKKDGKKKLAIFYLIATIVLVAMIGFLVYTLINPNW